MKTKTKKETGIKVKILGMRKYFFFRSPTIEVVKMSLDILGYTPEQYCWEYYDYLVKNKYRKQQKEKEKEKCKFQLNFLKELA